MSEVEKVVDVHVSNLEKSDSHGTLIPGYRHQDRILEGEQTKDQERH